MTKHVTAIFRSTTAIERAGQALFDAGFTPDQISLLMSDETREDLYPEQDDGALPVSAPGIGLVAGGLRDLASLGVPNGVAVAGPLAVFVNGAGAGLVSGGLVDGLVGAGVSEERAQLYEAEIESGGIVVGVKAEDDERAARAEEILRIAADPAAERHVAMVQPG